MRSQRGTGYEFKIRSFYYDVLYLYTGLEDAYFQVKTVSGGEGIGTARRGITASEARLASHCVGKQAVCSQAIAVDCFGRILGQGAMEVPADKITGPYEGRVVFQDRGIAQGGLVDTPDGRWFAYLRTLANQPKRICHIPQVDFANLIKTFSYLSLALFKFYALLKTFAKFLCKLIVTLNDIKSNTS